MIYLTAEKKATQFYFKVHMDETKILNATRAAELQLPVGSPDPGFVREYSWGLTPPQGQTETVYLANIKTEIGLLVGLELAEMNPAPTPAPTPLAGF